MAWHGQPWAQAPHPYMHPGIDPRFGHGAGFVPTPPPQWYTPPEAFQQQPLVSPPATHARSGRYPQLNPALAEDTTVVRFDVKHTPAKTILSQMYQTARGEYALAAPTQHMRLICKYFPWTIEIKSLANNHVTCDDVWSGIWNALQINLVDSEWGYIIKDKGLVETINNSVRKRVEADPNADKHPKRIDCLGDMTVFRGLEKDDEFAKLKLLPFSPKCDQTWVIRLTT